VNINFDGPRDSGAVTSFLLRFSLYRDFVVLKRIYVLRWWGQEDPRVKKLDDLMPINVTVTDSGKIALLEFIKYVTIYISSFKARLNSKVCLFSLGMSRCIHAAH